MQNNKVKAISSERKILIEFENRGSVCSIQYGLLRALYSREVHQEKEETTQVGGIHFLISLFVLFTRYLLR